jgi:hypothetical protein
MKLGYAILAFVAAYLFLKAIAEADNEAPFIFWPALIATAVYLIL